MKHSGSTIHYGKMALCVAASALTLMACSKKADESSTATTTTATVNDTGTTTTTTGTTDVAAAPKAAAPAPDNTDTISGVEYASYTGDSAKGKIAFLTCQTCHAIDAGVNKIGPSLHAVVGRHAGSIPGFAYTPANKNSGITWSEDKLFQYLENPQRVVPGTKMTFAGFSDPQKRADVIAYLKTNS